MLREQDRVHKSSLRAYRAASVSLSAGGFQIACMSSLVFSPTAEEAENEESEEEAMLCQSFVLGRRSQSFVDLSFFSQPSLLTLGLGFLEQFCPSILNFVFFSKKINTEHVGI